MSEPKDPAARAQNRREAAVNKHLTQEFHDFMQRGSHSEKCLLLSALVHHADMGGSLMASLVMAVTGTPLGERPADAFESIPTTNPNPRPAPCPLNPGGEHVPDSCFGDDRRRTEQCLCGMVRSLTVKCGPWVAAGGGDAA